MRLAVSPQPQNTMRGQLRFAAFDHMLSFIVRQHDPLGAPLKQQHDGAGLGPNLRRRTPLLDEREAVDKRLESLPSVTNLAWNAPTRLS